MKINVTISIDDTTINRYREQCKVHGMKISSRVETLIEKDIVTLEQINTQKQR